MVLAATVSNGNYPTRVLGLQLESDACFTANEYMIYIYHIYIYEYSDITPKFKKKNNKLSHL